MRMISKIHWWLKEKNTLLFKKYFLLTKNSKIRYYEKRYYKEFGVTLNIKHPSTFYDKVNYLKFFYFTNEMTNFTDKIKAKEIVNSFNGNCKVAKIIKIFSSYKKFVEWTKEFSGIEKECVIKTNNGSGVVFFVTKNSQNKVVIRDKHGYTVEKNKMLKLVKRSLRTNWYYQEFEKNYKGIKSKVFVEEYFSTMREKGLNEYKFFCNYGKVKMINVVYNRQDDANLKEVFADEFLNPLNTHQKRESIEEKQIIRPRYFDEMAEFASCLSQKFPLLRVDFLCDDNSYYFCEFTFYDFGGFSCFYPESDNKRIGDLFDLSPLTKKS